MLVLSRGTNETVILTVPGIGRIEVMVTGKKVNGEILLGFSAPRCVRIDRSEISDARDRVIQNTPTVLRWDFDGEGEWEAASCVEENEGCPFHYRIQVCDDGSFDISRSDSELGLRDRETFSTLTLAKFACEEQEAEWRETGKREQRQSVT